MEPELPSWLNESFLTTALVEEHEKAPVTDLKFSASMAVAPGNNYLSHLYRVEISYTTGEREEKTSLMVKAPLTKGLAKKISQEFDVFTKECRIYNEVLPLMKDKTSCMFGPKVYYSAVKDVIVLKDLNEDGYVMCDRLKQLDYPHCEIVLKTLAKFHATSVACHKDHSDLIETVGEEGMYKLGGRFENEMRPWLQLCVKTIAGIALQTEECKSIAEEILSKAEQVTETAVKLVKPSDTVLNVLNHGDLWINNILFKHNETGEILDVKFIDFQISRYASPVLDLLYFLWSSSNADVRANKIHVLLEVYRETLNRTLEELGCSERLSAEELRKDLLESEDWAIITICGMLPILLCVPDDVINVEEVNEEDMKVDQLDSNHQIMKLFTGKHLIAAIPGIMLHFKAWKSSIA